MFKQFIYWLGCLDESSGTFVGLIAILLLIIVGLLIGAV